MKYQSTRNPNLKFSLTDAIRSGLAPDGGLFFPESIPEVNYKEFLQIDLIHNFAHKFLKPFFDSDPLMESLFDICKETLDFTIPLNEVGTDFVFLELFHGPTGAFKDFGARFLAACFSRLGRPLTILVATSGDTGSAVASALHNVKNLTGVILYPKDKISSFQEKQLITWDNNILSLRVNGDFDDCQSLVKEAFSDQKLSSEFSLTSANSINIGRLLPQMVYYAFSCMKYLKMRSKIPSFIVPTGNMGNVLACILVKKMGFPINDIIISTNENRVIPDYFDTKQFKSAPSITTIANSMDVGGPSNMERYLFLLDQFGPDIEESIRAISVSNRQIRAIIQKVDKEWNYICCPHTATAVFAWENIHVDNAIIVATAHPSKFLDEIRDLLDKDIEIPDQLKRALTKPSKFTDISVLLKELEAALREFFN
ncbi:MAG: threonine synthase [Candidatus Heimdallarchaeota archaeon]|nr:threonine synthase [Candidatus Heimdallarchaeota archaeon]